LGKGVKSQGGNHELKGGIEDETARPTFSEFGGDKRTNVSITLGGGGGGK